MLSGSWRSPSRRILAVAISFCALAVTLYGFISGADRLRDFAGYYTAARALTEGHPTVNLYDDLWFHQALVRYGIDEPTIVMYVNPPAIALLVMPLVPFPPFTAKLLWNIISLLAVLAGWRVLLPVVNMSPREWRSIVLLGCILTSTPFLRNLQLGQVYTLLFLLFAVLSRAYLAARPAVTGLALAGSMTLKLYGWVFPVLFLFGKKWRFLAWSVLLPGALLAVCVLLFGAEAYRAQWDRIASMSGAADTASLALRSVVAPLSRLFVFHPQWNPGAVTHLPLIPIVLPPILLFTALWMTFQKTSADPLTALAAVLVLSVVFTPLAADHHYVLLWIPAAILLTRPTGIHPAVAAAVLFLTFGWLPSPPPGILQGWGVLLAYSRLYGAIALWWLLLRTNRPAALIPH